MSYTHKFGINPSTGCVTRILFEREYTDQGVTVKANFSWTPDNIDLRPADWTPELLDVEYAKCDQVVRFTDLLQNRWQKRVGRGATAEVVQLFNQEEQDDSSQDPSP